MEQESIHRGPLAILEDMHVHSTFSDGQSSIAENVEAALRLGLTRMCCVDHVRRDTGWVPDFVGEVRRVQAEHSQLKLLCGLEAKILNQAGALDLPPSTSGADYVYAADHRFPIGETCYAPQVVRQLLREGSITPAGAIACLIEATRNAMLSRSGLVLAHLFSILPKAGLHEDGVSDAQLEELAATALRSGATIEVDERWFCPSLRTTAAFYRKGVPVICSTDSHRAESIGQYVYVRSVINGLVESVCA